MARFVFRFVFGLFFPQARVFNNFSGLFSGLFLAILVAFAFVFSNFSGLFFQNNIFLSHPTAPQDIGRLIMFSMLPWLRVLAPCSLSNVLVAPLASSEWEFFSHGDPAHPSQLKTRRSRRAGRSALPDSTITLAARAYDQTLRLPY